MPYHAEIKPCTERHETGYEELLIQHIASTKTYGTKNWRAIPVPDTARQQC